MIHITVNRRRLTAVTDEPLVAKTVGVVTFEAEFDPEWDRYEKYIVFAPSGCPGIPQLYLGGEVEVDHRALDRSGHLWITAVGLAEGRREVTAKMEKTLYVYENGDLGQEPPPEEQSPSLLEQAVLACAKSAREAKDAAEEAKKLLENGGSGSGGSGGGTPGKDGGYYTPQVTQPDKSTMRVAFVPSRAGMPEVEEVDVELPAGPAGKAGLDGADGNDGAPGAPGERGPEGQPGKDGKDGAPGLQGPPGKDGATGKTPNIQIGAVETLESGSNATASIGGTPENPLLNLGIPRGADGASDGSKNTWKKLFTIVLPEETSKIEKSIEENQFREVIVRASVPGAVAGNGATYLGINNVLVHYFGSLSSQTKTNLFCYVCLDNELNVINSFGGLIAHANAGTMTQVIPLKNMSSVNNIVDNIRTIYLMNTAAVFLAETKLEVWGR